MATTINLADDLTRGGFDLMAAHSPIVFEARLNNATSTSSTGDVTIQLQGTVNAEDTTAYTFEMGYLYSEADGGSGDGYDHYFRLNVTDIVRGIINESLMQDDTGGGDNDRENRMATQITVTIAGDGAASPVEEIYWFAHGFNQVNNPDSSCLVDFANKAVDAIVPGVPGAPMLWNLWNPSSYNPAGSTYVRLYDEASSITWGVAVSKAVEKGLIQLTSTYINTNFYDNFNDKIEEFQLWVQDSVALAGNGMAKYVAFRLPCEGDVLLGWLNRYGTFSYMVFERFPTIKGEQKHIGSYNIEETDIADLQSRTKSRGYKEARDVVSAIARGIPTEYFPVIEDLYYSMDVYYFTGTLPEYEFDATEWLRVQVRGNLVEQKKHSFGNVSVDIILPEKYTQLR